MEVKEQNFKRVAEGRTNKIIAMIRLLGNLSNRSFYEFTDEQVKTIFDAIQNELNTQRKVFEDQKKSKHRFQL